MKPPSFRELFLAHSCPIGWALVAEGIPSRGRLWRYAPHIAMFNRHACDMATGAKKKLIVSAPPRHSKSLSMAQWLPAWWLAHHPDQEVAIVSSTSDLAETHSGYARDIMIKHGRRYFGRQVRLGRRASPNGWQIEDHRGRCHAIGVGGTFVGKGAHLMVIDDPIKNAQQAYSSHQRDMLWRWWCNVASTRVNPGGVCLLMNTRWHMDDLTGRLLEADPDGWDVLNLPALAVEDDPLGREPGEALWPEMYDEAWHHDKRRQDPVVFAAQYQGDPTPSDGAIFSRDRFRYAVDRGEYFELLGALGETRQVTKSSCLWFMTCDMALRTSEQNDYTAVCVGAMTPDRELIVADMVRGKWSLTEQWPRIKAIAAAHPRVRYIAVEHRGAGHGVIAAAARDGIALKKLKADTEKRQRAMPASVAYGDGQIYHLRGAHWLEELERELVLFPAGKHDDQVDCLANAWLETTTSASKAVMMSVSPDGEVKTSWEREPDEAPAEPKPKRRPRRGLQRRKNRSEGFWG